LGNGTFQIVSSSEGLGTQAADSRYSWIRHKRMRDRKMSELNSAINWAVTETFQTSNSDNRQRIT
jgi:hypothetical protein